MMTDGVWSRIDAHQDSCRPPSNGLKLASVDHFNYVERICRGRIGL